MRPKGSVTVVFSFVFVIMFSFILSFFEMASYTARRAYHASASLLATENYFAAYLKPLYEYYHIFGKEVPEGEDMVSWSEQSIAEDLSYMTVKQEGEKSLLLRSGADFGIKDVSVLTENELEGFYSQAVNSMKYRAIPEAVNMLKDFAGMTEQADAHLEMAATKAATDRAYAEVDNKILHLMELIDGVDVAEYEMYMTGKSGMFQKDTYVKYFCTNPEAAAGFFDRTEVYQAFLSNFENPAETLDALASEAEVLANEIDERIAAEIVCDAELSKVREQKDKVSAKIKELGSQQAEKTTERNELIEELDELTRSGQGGKRAEALPKQIKELKKQIEDIKEEKAPYQDEEKRLKEQEEQLEKERKTLKQKKKDQEKRCKVLVETEEAFIERSRIIRDICGEAYVYVEDIQQELVKAKKVKANCEKVLDSLQIVIGKEAAEEYRNELQKYSFYERAEGFDFEQMRQTLDDNEWKLWEISRHLSGTDSTVFRMAAEELRKERDIVAAYSWEGLYLDYGEMSLEESSYDDVGSMISKEVASGFLGFLTEEEVSEKELDLSYLPSGFRYKEEEADVFSLLGTDMSEVFTELRTLLPEDVSADVVLGGVTDSIFFHSYLATHFSDFMEDNKNGALSYELEYLIAGKGTDEENLSAFAMRICAVRAILHFVSLYTDSARKGVAEQAALAACGIIGLPALKSVITVLLLFVWALEEAMIDTSALLQGKKLLLYPGKNGGSLAFHEIFLLSKSFVLERAKLKPEKGGAIMGYNEFLHLFLYLTPQNTKKYRAADLIQENLRKNYQDSFRIKRCVWKVLYETDGRSYKYAYE